MTVVLAKATCPAGHRWCTAHGGDYHRTDNVAVTAWDLNSNEDVEVTLQGERDDGFDTVDGVVWFRHGHEVIELSAAVAWRLGNAMTAAASAVMVREQPGNVDRGWGW